MNIDKTIIKSPSAFLPILMSTAALTLLILNLVVFGIPKVPSTDEGTAAHIFQLLMGGQIPIILFFAIKWLPKKPKEAIIVLIFQLFAGLLAFAPVYILKL